MFRSTAYEEWLRHDYVPILGADDDDDDTTTTTATTTATGDDNDTDTSTTTATGDDDADDSDSDDDDTSSDSSDTDADLDELTRVKRERDEARTKLVNAEAAARKAKQDARKAREDAAKKGGNWEQVAAERLAELEEANETLQTSQREKVEAQNDLDSFRREVRITRIANALSFRDTNDAVTLLKDKPESTGDDKTCLRALRKIAGEKSYLIDQKRARGRAMAGDTNGGGLTHDQLKDLTAEQINERWEKGGIQQALANPPSRGGG